VRQVDLGERHQEVAIAAQPPDVATVECNPETGGLRAVDFVSSDLGVEAGVELPKRLVVGRLAVAVNIRSDEAEVDRQDDRGVLDQRERRLGRDQVTDEFLENHSKVVISDRVWLRVRGDREPRKRYHSGDIGLQSVLEEPLDKVFDCADKLDRAEPKSGLVVIGMGLEDFAQGFLTALEVARDQVLFGDMSILGGRCRTNGDRGEEDEGEGGAHGDGLQFNEAISIPPGPCQCYQNPRTIHTS
jgi:hypothetical protein